MEVVDIHSHIHFEDFKGDLDNVLSRMRGNNILTITVGTSTKSSISAVELANKEDIVFASVGIHPTDSKEFFDDDVFLSLASDARVVSIGECGLDYFRIDNDKEEKERQKELFIKHIKLAVNLRKPLMIHCRASSGTSDADRDLLEILKNFKEVEGDKLFGNIHFFTQSLEIANEYINLGFTLSFPGVITFSKEVMDVAKEVDESMIHVETDSPYASPVPNRGIRNEPSFVLNTLSALALEKGVKVEDLAEKIRGNNRRIFGI